MASFSPWNVKKEGQWPGTQRWPKGLRLGQGSHGKGEQTPSEEVSSLWLEVCKQDAVGKSPEVRPKTSHRWSQKAQSRSHHSAVLLAL